MMLLRSVLLTACIIVVQTLGVFEGKAAETKVRRTWNFTDLEVEIVSLLATGATEYTSPVLFGGPDASIVGTVGNAYVTASGKTAYVDTAGIDTQSGESIVVVRARSRGTLNIKPDGGDIELFTAGGQPMKPLLGVKKVGAAVGTGKWAEGEYPFILPGGTKELAIRVRRGKPIKVRLAR